MAILALMGETLGNSAEAVGIITFADKLWTSVMRVSAGSTLCIYFSNEIPMSEQREFCLSCMRLNCSGPQGKRLLTIPILVLFVDLCNFRKSFFSVHCIS